MSIFKLAEEVTSSEDNLEEPSYTLYDRGVESQVDLTYHSSGSVQRDMWVVFYDPPSDLWWNKYLHKGYHHCMTIQWDGFMWILNNHTLGHTETMTLPVEEWKHVKMFIEHWWEGENFSYVHVNRVLDSERSKRIKWLFTPYTCTELVKAHLGVEDYFTWTPYQLYKLLKKNSEILEEDEQL